MPTDFTWATALAAFVTGLLVGLGWQSATLVYNALRATSISIRDIILIVVIVVIIIVVIFL